MPQVDCLCLFSYIHKVFSKPFQLLHFKPLNQCLFQGLWSCFSLGEKHQAKMSLKRPEVTSSTLLFLVASLGEDQLSSLWYHCMRPCCSMETDLQTEQTFCREPLSLFASPKGDWWSAEHQKCSVAKEALSKLSVLNSPMQPLSRSNSRYQPGHFPYCWTSFLSF